MPKYSETRAPGIGPPLWELPFEPAAPLVRAVRDAISRFTSWRLWVVDTGICDEASQISGRDSAVTQMYGDPCEKCNSEDATEPLSAQKTAEMTTVHAQSARIR